jgi:hypothetical protein
MPVRQVTAECVDHLPPSGREHPAIGSVGTSAAGCSIARATTVGPYPTWRHRTLQRERCPDHVPNDHPGSTSGNTEKLDAPGPYTSVLTAVRIGAGATPRPVRAWPFASRRFRSGPALGACAFQPHGWQPTISIQALGSSLARSGGRRYPSFQLVDSKGCVGSTILASCPITHSNLGWRNRTTSWFEAGTIS